MEPQDSGIEILIVEDSPTQALKLLRVLTRHGHRASIARGGPQALEVLAERIPDLVLCEIGLSGMDGYELCRQIKAREGLAYVPVILLTSFLEPTGAIRALQCGADDLLPRVFEEQALLSCLADIRANLNPRRDSLGPSDAEVRLAGVTYPLPPDCGPRALAMLLSSYRIAVERSLELRQAREALECQAEEREKPPAPTEPPAPAPTEPPAPAPRRLRVLVAEDSDVNQRLAVRTLEKRGFDVSVAGNGRQALDALEGGRFDLVLMDVEMPEMDGFQATAAIRAWEQGTGTHLPIIAMTAHDRPEDLARCLAAGMDAYTAKPLRADALMAAMRQVVPGGLPEAPAPQ